LALLAVLGLAAIAWDVATYDARAWHADYEHLKRELAQRYANLDWMVEHRRMDLKTLDAEAAAAIDGAHSRVLAILALRRFVRAFKDPHLKLVWADRAGRAAPAAAGPAKSAPVASCDAAGYESDDHAFRFPFDRLAGWTPVRTGDFPSGIAGDLGVLRIAAFGEDRYAAICAQAFRTGLTARELQLAVRARLQQLLIATLEELKARGAKRLLIDISGNGGGTEWVTEVVALLTDRELVRQSARLVAPACDRSAIWRGETACPVLAPAGEPSRLTGSGHWTGPLFILADNKTGSASEDFVAWLQQNGVGVVLGARTAGAGCGYVDGGGRIRLSQGPFDVMAPNCARFLNDGTNEIEGIKPDIEIPMTAEALTAALDRR
jgi:hypothetical protein